MDRLEYESLKPYCANELQRERLDLTFQLGSARAAARKLGVAKNAVAQSLNIIRQRAAEKAHVPHEHFEGKTPAGFSIQKRTVQIGPDGVERQWVREHRDATLKHEMIVQQMQEASESLKGLVLPSKAPERSCEELLAVYPYGDPHVGMYAWRGDAADDFDLKAAVELMTEATRSLVDSAPPAEQALVCFLGDFYHADDQSNRTRKSGHQLDVDSRWSKVFRVGVETAIALIKLALQKHRKVRVITELGNHDDHTALALAVCLDLFFHRDPRVEVDTSARSYHYHRFGANLIGTHHGHLAKPNQLPQIMAADQPEDWGATKHRAWYTGHIHTQNRWDFAGCEVESFRILPPGDAWTHSMGYRAARSMDCIIRHRDRGEVARHTVHAGDL